MLNKKEILAVLEEIADLYDFQGENPFRGRSFRNAANALRRMEGDLIDAAKNDELQKIKGVGKKIAEVVKELVEEGDAVLYYELRNAVPPGAIELMSVRGVGPGKAAALYRELGVDSLDAFERALKSGETAKLKGFGEKTVEKLIGEVRRMKAARDKALLDRGEKIAAALNDFLNSLAVVEETAIVGEARRAREIIKRVEIVALVKSIDLAKKEIAKSYATEERKDGSLGVPEEFETDAAVWLVEDPKLFAPTIFLKTGSSEYLERLGVRASDANGETEEEIYRAIGAPYQPPEMREALWADAPDDLRQPTDLTLDDLRGMLHWHTDRTDGAHSLREMVEAGMKRGYDYFAVCDHSKFSAFVNGLTEKRALEQKAETRTLADELGVPVLQGIEADILKDGALDYDDDFLGEFDFIVASVHQRFGLDEDAMTKRLLRAVENPHTDVLGHPTGRLLLERPPYAVDLRKVIDACAANDVAIEINANPRRLDLDWRELYYAREKGARFAINADAHSTDGIDYAKYGVLVARKGGVKKSEVVNALPFEEFETFLRRKVNRPLLS
jgi:DNA polymerase (family 10)